MIQQEEYPDNRELRRGEIYFIDLSDIEYINPHIQNKSRPGMIIQNDIGNSASHNIIVALLTSTDKKFYPFQYKINLNGRDSVIMFDQLITLPRARIGNKLGELSQQQTVEADSALMCSLGLSKYSITNITNLDIKSMTTEKTKVSEITYYTFELTYSVALRTFVTEIKVLLDLLKEFDPTITKETDLGKIITTFDCCAGLNFIINHSCDLACAR